MIDVWRLRNGARVTLRPILPQDGPLLGDMLTRLSPAARHHRFHGGVRSVTPAQLAQLSAVDYRRHVAFVITASAPSGEQVIAEARYCVDAEGADDSAEFALVVDDRWQRRGLGLRALDTLAESAAAAGLRWLRGSVLAHNRPMLALLRRCRFHCIGDGSSAGVVQVEAALRPHAPPVTLAPHAVLDRVASWWRWRRDDRWRPVGSPRDPATHDRHPSANF